jgi:predicted MFS family arabinose efflux permease
VLGPYRAVLSTPGAPAFEVAGLVARLPIATVGLGIVLLVSTRTGSYALAGALSATALVAQAAASPMMARLIDRVGQARVLVPAFAGFTVANVLMVAAVEADLSTPLPHLAAAAVGALEPPIGACVRARWRHALAEGPLLHTAFSLEAVIDEAVFIVGPVIVTILATQVHESAGLLTIAVVATMGGWWLAAQRSTEPPTSRGSDGAREFAEPMRWPGLVPIIVVGILLGSLFGATEVVTVAFAQEHGHRSATAALLGAWAFGSLIAGLVTGAVPWRSSARTRYRVGSLALTAAMTPLPFIDGLWLLGGVLFVAGFAISPTLVATVSLIDDTVPSRRLTEGITWVTTGLGLGVAAGAAIAGHLIDAHGASAAFWLSTASGALATAVAWTTRIDPPSETLVTPATAVTHDPAEPARRAARFRRSGRGSGETESRN